MADNTYVNIGIDEFKAVLEPLKFRIVEVDRTAEIVFSKVITFEGAPTILRIYTAVLKSNGQSRPAGQDMIRICLGRMIDDGSGRNGVVKIFKTLRRIRRIGTWKIHLLEALVALGDGLAKLPPPGLSSSLTEADLLAGRTTPITHQTSHQASHPPVLGQKLKCPLCGAKMVGPKSGRLGPFYGCSRYHPGPGGCRGLRNLRDVPLDDKGQPPAEMLWSAPGPVQPAGPTGSRLLDPDLAAVLAKVLAGK